MSEKKNETNNVVYLIRNKHLPGHQYFSKDSSSEKGFNWTEFPYAAVFRGEEGRGRAYNAARLVRQDCGYVDLVVEKFKLVPVDDN